MTLKRFLKRTVLALATAAVSPLILLARAGLRCNSNRLFGAPAHFLALVPGGIGSYLRLGYYRGTLRRIGPDVCIGFGTFFSTPRAALGNRINIGAYCIIGQAEIGDEVLIASRVSILSGKYEHGSAFVPLSNPEGFRSQVRIGSRTWIGEGAVVAADVGANSLVATGAVVTREVPEAHLAAGNPARPVRIQPFRDLLAPTGTDAGIAQSA